MLPADIDTYSGEKVNAKPIDAPTSQYGEAAWNKAHSDLAQLTRPSIRVAVYFPTLTSNGAVTPSSVTARSVWGTGSAQKPTVTRTGTGLYTVQWASTYDDGLTVPTTETVGFVIPVSILTVSSDAADIVDARVLTMGANVVTLATYASGALADVGNSSSAVFNVSLSVI